MEPKNIVGTNSQVSDNLTILWTIPGKSAQKTFTRDATSGRIEKIDFDSGYFFTASSPIALTSIYDLHEALQFLQNLPNALVIRGEPLDPNSLTGYIQRKGSGSGANFQGNFQTPSKGRKWILVDIDKLKLPSALTLSPATLKKILNWVQAQLPPELKNVTFHWQLSSSAGVFDDKHVSVHLWFWLTQPVSDDDLKEWATTFNAVSSSLKIDCSLFQHVQPHYTASPKFVGMADPFHLRSGLINGAAHAATIMPTKKVASTLPNPKPPTSSGSIQTTTGFDNIIATIGDHPGGEGFRGPLLRATASYARSHGAENTNPELLYRLLREAVLKADASAHGPDEIADRASRGTIMPMITSAIVKYGNQKSISSPHSKKGIAPATPVEDGHLSPSQLAQQVQSFFNF